jgi:hypothetical protein
VKIPQEVSKVKNGYYWAILFLGTKPEPVEVDDTQVWSIGSDMSMSLDGVRILGPLGSPPPALPGDKNAMGNQEESTMPWTITDYPKQMGDAGSDYIGWIRIADGLYAHVQIGFQCGSAERANAIMEQMAGLASHDGEAGTFSLSHTANMLPIPSELEKDDESE